MQLPSLPLLKSGPDSVGLVAKRLDIEPAD